MASSAISHRRRVQDGAVHLPASAPVQRADPGEWGGVFDRDFCLAAEAVSACAEHMADPPTEFERLTAMALGHFQQVRCRIVVLEVGLGGRMDATNVIDAPEAAVITQLGLEHTRELGSTLRRIAGEKSGILKPGCAAVLCRQEPEAEQVVRETVRAPGPVPLVVTEEVRPAGGGWDGQVLDYRERRGIRLGLLGGYQRRNAAAALDTVDVLNARGFCIPEQAVRRGLAGVSWPGRFSLLRRDPWVIVDGAHNPNGAAELADSLRQYFPGQKITFVIGVMADKDCANILRAAVPLARVFFTVTPASPRAMNSGALAELIRGRFRVMAVDAETVSRGSGWPWGRQGRDPSASWGPSTRWGRHTTACTPACFPKHRRTDGSVCSKEEDRLADHRGEKRPAPGDPCAAGRPAGGISCPGRGRDRRGGGRLPGVPGCPDGHGICEHSGEEADLRPLLRQILRDGKRLAVPLCTGPGIMEARLISGLEQLAPGRYGILGAPGGESADPAGGYRPAHRTLRDLLPRRRVLRPLPGVLSGARHSGMPRPPAAAPRTSGPP